MSNARAKTAMPYVVGNPPPAMNAGIVRSGTGITPFLVGVPSAGTIYSTKAPEVDESR